MRLGGRKSLCSGMRSTLTAGPDTVRAKDPVLAVCSGRMETLEPQHGETGDEGAVLVVVDRDGELVAAGGGVARQVETVDAVAEDQIGI
jgi:hypothetical protein